MATTMTVTKPPGCCRISCAVRRCTGSFSNVICRLSSAAASPTSQRDGTHIEQHPDPPRPQIPHRPLQHRHPPESRQDVSPRRAPEGVADEQEGKEGAKGGGGHWRLSRRVGSEGADPKAGADEDPEEDQLPARTCEVSFDATSEEEKEGAQDPAARRTKRQSSWRR